MLEHSFLELQAAESSEKFEYYMIFMLSRFTETFLAIFTV